MALATAGISRAACDLPEGLKGIAGHVLVAFSVDDSGSLSSFKPLYLKTDPVDQGNNLVKALEKCLREDPMAGMEKTDLPTDGSILKSYHFFRPAPESSKKVKLIGNRTVPRAWLEEIGSEKRRLLDELTPQDRFWKKQGKGWTLRSDLDEGYAGEMLDAIQFAETAFREAFPSAPEVEDDGSVSLVVFRGEIAHNALAAFDNLSVYAGFVSGHYTPWDRMIYTAAAPDVPLQRSFAVISHEYTHHLIYQSLLDGIRDAPFWVQEGVAEFVESIARPGDGSFDLRRVNRQIMYKGNYAWHPQGMIHVDQLKAAMDNGEMPSMESVTSYSPLEDDREAEPLMRSAAWLLVHYLINADDGRRRKRFADWIRSPAAVESGASLEKSLGISFEDLDGRLAAYLEKI